MDVRLLIVDQAEEYTLTVREHLADAGPGWSVTHAPRPSDAHLVITEAAFDAALVVLGSEDQETLDLLDALRHHQPDCVRLVLADVHTLERAHQLVSVCHRVLVSPCEPLSLQMAVEHTRRLQETLGRTGMRALGLRRRFRDSRHPTGDLLSSE